ncbi:hypothetical protein [Methylotenera sp.]|uniref:hypothetical protein n=1 Tax=Methylotenera sp. TaxID=2051956 RepID=UPI0025D2DCCE|nr:hypothetical protein [Methylotenera sp.]
MYVISTPVRNRIASEMVAYMRGLGTEMSEKAAQALGLREDSNEVCGIPTRAKYCASEVVVPYPPLSVLGPCR